MVVTLSVDLASSITYASYQNAVPVLRSLVVSNPTAQLLEHCRIELSTTPPFLRPKTWALDRLQAGDELVITDRRVELDPAYLARLDEAERGEITLILRQGDIVLAEERTLVRLLARDEWGGADMAQLLAAFVTPNDPAVGKLLRSASDILAQHGHQPGLDGYQSNDAGRVRLMASALYAAATAADIHYAEPPASFERHGQKVRHPSAILASGLATCLDSTLLLAALFEASGLNAVLLMFAGHAAVGVWLRKRTLPHAMVNEPMEIRKALAAGELLVLETTGLTRRPAMPLDAAQSVLMLRLDEGREHEFQCAIDVRRQRDGGIMPLATHEAGGTDAGERVQIDIGLPVWGPDLAPEPIPQEQKPTTPQGRIERWQQKLLDLTLRNRLLNFKDSKKTVPFLCTDIGYLEDRLAASVPIRIISLPEQNPLGGRDLDLYRDVRGHDMHRGFAAEALSRDELPSPLPSHTLEARLVDLHREAKNDLSEGGTNTLFLAVGFLRWRRQGEVRDYRAPLLLVPVRLERAAASARFSLRFHEDEARFNATLLKFLEEEFDLRLAQFEGPLPLDENGIDVPRLLADVRRAVRDVPGMEVISETALSTFSFAKYLMWKDLVDRTDLLRQNAVVRHLIDTPEAPFPGASRPAAQERDLDRKYKPSDVVSLLPADSSQIIASLLAAEGHDMVIVGPPGTGKSQTIANMIANCLAVGKTVLFVAEKSAALNVVYRRLREHGLGNLCLELHSSRADRKSFLSQLREAWQQGTGADAAEWVSANERLRLKRDELNAYVDALHRRQANGLSVYAALGLVLREEGRYAPDLAWSHANAHDPDTRRALEDLAEELGRVFAAVGTRPEFGIIGTENWSSAWQQDLLAAAGRLRVEARQLMDAFGLFLRSLGLSERPSAPLGEIGRFERLASALSACAGADHSIFYDPDFDQVLPAIQALEANIASTHAALTRIGGRIAFGEVPRIPVDDLDRDWREACAAVWPLRINRQGRVRRLLSSYATVDVDPQEILPLLRLAQAHLAQIDASPLAAKALAFKGIESDTAGMRAIVARAQALQDAFIALDFDVDELHVASAAVDPVISQQRDGRGIRPAAAALTQALASFAGAAKEMARTARCSLTALVGSGALADVVHAMEAVEASRTSLAEWTTWVNIRGKAEAHGLAPLVEALLAGRLRPDETRAALRLAYVRWWLPLAIDGDRVLQGFRRFQHEHAIDRFRSLDDLVRTHAAARVRQAISHGLPPVQSVARNSELGLLRHQMELQRPSRSIREMVGAMPETFSKLAPCMLMSPLSIAQFLPAGHALFDVVIFDEASQITTWDAVGAIARGKQTIIVGDPKQLPPTNFFGRNEEDGEIQEHERDLESILDEAKASGLPVRDLRWHYRSRSESLIAFSNQQYYGNRLVTFPSPDIEDRAVKLRLVPEGVYDRGKSRTNAIEARAVVAEAVGRMRAWLKLPEKARPTLAIITFNAQQQGLIQDHLDSARVAEPEIEWFFADDRYEPTIVKNLENVQGDERDIILFSITFTKDAAGVRRMDFGALNRDGGERRLNVAVTRARQELIVFSGTSADDIDIGRTKAIGPRHLKAFLDYAARGVVALAAQERGSLGGYDSPFEEAVAKALEQRGWQIVTQVGVSAFRVDLGVKHPDRAGKFLAGVECDGATYHGSATARDRDKVREEVLRGLGWNIVRVWSTDWWLDSRGAAERLDAALRELLEASRHAEAASEQPGHWELGETLDPVGDDAAPSVSTAEGNSAVEAVADDQEAFVVELLRQMAVSPLPSDPPQAPNESDQSAGVAARGPEAPQATSEGQAVYRLADLSGFPAAPDQFFEEGYGPILSAMVEAVLASEAPLREDLLAQRIARAHGWLRTGSRIKMQIGRHLKNVERIQETTGDFLWHVGTVCELLPYRHPERDSTKRDVAEIPLAELSSIVVEHSALLEEPDPVLALARRVGISRLVASTRPRLGEAIERARAAIHRSAQADLPN